AGADAATRTADAPGAMCTQVQPLMARTSNGTNADDLRMDLAPWVAVPAIFADGAAPRIAAGLTRGDRLAVGVDHRDLAEAQRTHRRLDLRKITHHDPGQGVGVERLRRLGHLRRG